MSDELSNPLPDPTKSEEVKSAEEREAQARQAKAKLARSGGGRKNNPVVDDETYGELREKNRVVMRHQIALNIDNFRAAGDDFQARPDRTYAPLQPLAPPLMSVIIPNHNGVALLPTVLDALAGQSFRDFETIVVDDASSDDSVALIERDYPHVRILVNRRNQGFAASCNAAADAAAGRVLVLLNNDTEPEPTWLEELAHAVMTHPQAAVVTSKILLFHQRDTLHTTGDELGVDGIPRNRGVWQQDRGQFDDAQAVFSGCGAATAYRRDVWRALGGFDESFWMYLEDVDYAFRARLLGYETHFAPAARVYHRLSASGGDTLSSYYVGRNTIWTIAKNMPQTLLLRNLGRIVAAQVAIAVDALRNGRGMAARARLRGQIAGLLGLPAVLRKRERIQSRRLASDERIAAALID